MNTPFTWALCGLLFIAVLTIICLAFALRAAMREGQSLRGKIADLEERISALLVSKAVEFDRKSAYATGLVWILCMGYGRSKPGLTPMAHKLLNEMLEDVKHRPVVGPGLNTRSYPKEQTPP